MSTSRTMQPQLPLAHTQQPTHARLAASTARVGWAVGGRSERTGRRVTTKNQKKPNRPTDCCSCCNQAALPLPLPPQPACSLVGMRIYGGASQRPSLTVCARAQRPALFVFSFLFDRPLRRHPISGLQTIERIIRLAQRAVQRLRGDGVWLQCSAARLAGWSEWQRQADGGTALHVGGLSAAAAADHRSHEWTAAAAPGRDTTANQSLSYAAPLPACATREAAGRPRRRAFTRRERRRFRAGALPHHQRVALIFRHGQQARCSLLCSSFCCHGNVRQCC